jgi:putative ATP-binding cassette transporter
LLPEGEAVMGGYLLATFFMMQPLGGMQQVLPQLGRARASLARLQALGLDLAAAEGINPGPCGPAGNWHSLELAGVAYAYRGERDEAGFTLGPLDLTFRPGELVFLGGGNGSGKTTFAKLLVGLYLPEGGEVRLNGEPVRAERLDAYRHLFAIVFSDFYLFDRLFGLDPAAVDAAAADHLERVRLAHRVRVENGAFSTIALSQGQRKRLALITALLEDRAVYVFDEWAADQDPEFKVFFYREILPALVARGKTVFVITHDDRFFDLASRIIKLEDGRVVSDRVPRVRTAVVMETV